MFPCHFTKQACSPGVTDAWSDYFFSDRGETESFQFQSEEFPVIQESTSQKVTTQGFGIFSEIQSNNCSLESNLNFDNGITKEESSRATSSSPHELHVLDYCNTFSFGSAPKIGASYLAEKKSLQTFALPKPVFCMSAGAPPRPYSLEKLAGGMEPAYSSCVSQIQPSGMFGSPTPIGTTFSDKTNVEKQVIPKCPVFQCDSKPAMTRRKCKKKVVDHHGATASEEFTEGTKVSVSLQLRAFYIQDATNVMLKSRQHLSNGKAALKRKAALKTFVF